MNVTRSALTHPQPVLARPMPVRQILSRFATAVTDAEADLPEGLSSWTGARPERRFDVYRNNVRVGLTGALASRFPATVRIVGEDFFSAMASAYVAAHPPRSPLLLAYGESFADFVSSFAPAARLAFLPDVIRIEAARGCAYHAADALALSPGMLASVPEEQLGHLTFTPHPSLSILRSAHPAVTIWEMNAGLRPLASIAGLGPEDALVVRPDMLVTVHRLPPGGASFFASLSHGICLGEAIGFATSAGPDGESGDFDLTANLSVLLSSGAFTHVSMEDH